MASKLGLHHNTVQDLTRLERFYHNARPAVALHLDLGNTELPEMIGETSPDTIVVGRKWFSSQPLDNPEERARRAAGAILDSSTVRAGLVDHVVGYNEIGPHPTHDYMTFDIHMARQLWDAAHLWYGVGSWSVGTPDVPDWESSWFTETLRVAGFLSLHEYCAPRMDDPRGMDGPDEGWFTLRYKKMLRSLRDQQLGFDLPPIIFTECGIDSGAAHWDPGGQGGWRTFTNAADYMEQLKWYDSHIQQEPLVLGATIFCIHDRSGDWTTFDVQGEMLDRLEAYMVEANEEQPPDIVPYPDWLVDMVYDLPRQGPYPQRQLDDIWRVVIHHSAAPPSVGPWQIAEYHVGELGWPGIGYHFCVATDGRAWQTQELEAMSYHAGPANADGVGVCLLGSFMGGNEPTDAQIETTKRIIEYVESVVGRPLELVGHQDVMDDRSCPGDTWHDWRWRLVTETQPKPDWEELYHTAAAQLDAVRAVVCD